MLSPNPTKQKQEKQNPEQEAQSRGLGDGGTKTESWEVGYNKLVETGTWDLTF